MIDLRALRVLREINAGTPSGGPAYLTSHGGKENTEIIFLMNLKSQNVIQRNPELDKINLRVLLGSVRTTLTRFSPPATAH